MWCSMASTLQLLVCLVVTIHLPWVTETQHHAGQPRDSASLGDGLKESEDPEVMFELLWSGLELDVMRQLRLQDEELASTRPGRRLRLLLQDHVPSDLKGAEQQLQQLQDLHKGPPLSPRDFEHLLLTSLSCIYWLHAANETEESSRWAQVFTFLAQEILWDLCKGFCPQGQHPSLWP
ncbi:protein FAM180B isoform X1 [Perognathus longimembris pacificus]|uniref:protein FAM180B isoform X1 n=1 Tax=Perognathus longimembris pacificus TaxID=214514 RepID=UPI002018CF45|nr:protein FAM180B isoform X1 [Perognathus longimembris pacificus]